MKYLFCLCFLGLLTTACGKGDTPADAAVPDAETVCVGCGEALETGDQPTCEGSAELLDVVGACACKGACVASCGDNVCMGAAPSEECQDCLIDSEAGCGYETTTCLAD